MISNDILEQFISILQNKSLIGPEYHSNEFTFGSINVYIDGLTNKKLINNKQNEFVTNLFIDLNDIKKNYFNHYSEHHDESISTIFISRLNEYLDKIDPATIKYNISIYATEWQEVADKYNVDISNEIQNIENIYNSLDDIKVIGKLKEEFQFLYQELKKIENITDVERSINLQQHSVDYKIAYKKLYDFFHDETKLCNNNEYNSLYSIIDSMPIQEILNQSKNIIKSIHEKIINEVPTLHFSLAEEYSSLVNKSNKNPITEQLSNKYLDEKMALRQDLNPFQKFKQVIIFEEDGSFLLNENGHLKVINDMESAKKVIEFILKNEINFKLRKKPTVAKQFISLLTNLTYFRSAQIAIETYLENENILKLTNFDLAAEVSGNGRSSFELLDDKMNVYINEHKLKQYAHSISSNKYTHLYDEKSYEIIKEIYELNIESRTLQDMIGKKIAAFKSPDEFNGALTKLLNNFNDFNSDSILEKAKSNKATIMINDHEIITLKIESFEASKVLGSSSWCISRHEHYFNSYTQNNQQQYFIFDFNKSSKDNESMIGMTLSPNGEYYTAHQKNDDSIEMNSLMKKIQLTIIIENITDFPSLSEDMKKEINGFKQNNPKYNKIKGLKI